MAHLLNQQMQVGSCIQCKLDFQEPHENCVVVCRSFHCPSGPLLSASGVAIEFNRCLIAEVEASEAPESWKPCLGADIPVSQKKPVGL